jgi:hypothetical protein
VNAPTPFLKHGNIYIVPALNGRLCCAELVRRTWLEVPKITGKPWASTDVVALSLPDSLRTAFLEALSLLPDDLSAITTSFAGDSHVEIYSVTPADPFVEAAQRALGDSVPLKFVDRDLEPSDLQGRSCGNTDNWPDDDLALHLGARSWLETIEAFYSFPPARQEPVDSLREMFMGLQLAKLMAQSSRILFVCHAGSVSALIRVLSMPVASFVTPLANSRKLSCVRRKLSTSGMLQTMDDYPALVERFALQRDGTEPFDRLEALRNFIIHTVGMATDLKVSPRRQIAFEQFLDNALCMTRCYFPKPTLLFDVAESCLGSPMANRLLTALFNYNNQIAAEIVPMGQLVKPRDSSHKVSAGRFVQRSCRPGASRVRSEAPNRPLEGSRDDTELHTWPDHSKARDRMMIRALQVVNQVRAELRSEPFRGSLGVGMI